MNRRCKIIFKHYLCSIIMCLLNHEMTNLINYSKSIYDFINFIIIFCHNFNFLIVLYNNVCNEQSVGFKINILINWVDIDEVVKNSKKEDNLNYLLFINRRFGGLFPSSSWFWKISEGNPMLHSPLSPLSVAVTILYRISFSAEE